ncbi:hypothetical protein ACLQ2P_41875 [Actinomadura citrea]|uniref:hypothetical protein n=1 Tax=Actinomadura citrea TaxID=46158 RepID=UPI003CE525AF
MKSGDVIAVCAIVVAVVSLGVSIMQGRAVRRHERNSVRPLLQLHRVVRHSGRTGVRLVNSGLGPAIVTQSMMCLDGAQVGSWDSAVAARLQAELALQFSYVTFNETEVLAPAAERYPLSVKKFAPQDHGHFLELIDHRIGIQIHYQSLYGETFMVTLSPKPAS